MEASSALSSENSPRSSKVRCLYCDHSVSAAGLMEHIANDLNCKPQACETCPFRCFEQQTMITHGVQTGHYVPLSTHPKVYKEYIVQMIATHSLDARRGIDLPTIFLPNTQHHRASTSRNRNRSVEKESDQSMDTNRSRKDDKRSERSDKRTRSTSSSPTPSPIRPVHKKCRYCKKLVAESKVDQYKHASTHLQNLHLNCPFCDYRKAGDAERVERHVRHKHPNENFTLLDIREKKELRKKASECFVQPGQKSTPKRKKPIAEVEPKSPRVAETTVSEPVPNTVPLVPVPPLSVPDTIVPTPGGTVICRICSASVPFSPACLKFHVARKHMGLEVYQVIDGNVEYNQKLSECFQTDTSANNAEAAAANPRTIEDKDICGICDRVIRSAQGKKSHVARYHFQKSIVCPYDSCDVKYLYADDLSKHMKAVHEINGISRTEHITLLFHERKVKHTIEMWPDLIKCFPDSFSGPQAMVNRANLNMTTSLVQQDQVTSSADDNVLPTPDVRGDGIFQRLALSEDTANQDVDVSHQSNVTTERISPDTHMIEPPSVTVPGENNVTEQVREREVEKVTSNRKESTKQHEKTEDQLHSNLSPNISLSNSRNQSIDDDIQFVREKTPRNRKPNRSKSYSDKNSYTAPVSSNDYKPHGPPPYMGVIGPLISPNGHSSPNGSYGNYGSHFANGGYVDFNNRNTNKSFHYNNSFENNGNYERNFNNRSWDRPRELLPMSGSSRPNSRGSAACPPNRSNSRSSTGGHTNRSNGRGSTPGPSNHSNWKGSTPGPSNRSNERGSTPGPSNRSNERGSTPGPSNRSNGKGSTPGPSNSRGSTTGPSGNSEKKPNNNNKKNQPNKKSASTTESSVTNSKPTKSKSRPIYGTMYWCSLCNERTIFKGLHTLDAHIWNHLAKKCRPEYSCSQCNFWSFTYPYAKHHWNVHKQRHGEFSVKTSLKTAIPGDMKEFAKFKRICYPDLDI